MNERLLVRILLVVATATAAGLWYASARIDLPNSQDDFVAALKLMGWWNSWAALASCIAAALAVLDLAIRR